MNYLYVRKSSNKKTGPIPQTYSQRETCPPSCSHYKTTCYAEGFHTRLAWNRAKDGIDLASLCAEIASLPDGQLWRHNIAGDLPGVGEDVDEAALQALTAANTGRRGFAFTAKHSQVAVAAAMQATAAGFTVNFSAGDLKQLDDLASRKAWPLVVTLRSDSPWKLKSPGGVPVVVCPAQTRENVTCESCGLCARADRSVAVGFLAHGNWSKLVDARVGV